MAKLNINQLDELLRIENATNEDLISELLGIFQLQLEEFMQFSVVLLDDDASFYQASQMAHRLKSSAGNLGMQEVELICLEIETLAKHQRFNSISKLLAKLHIESLLAAEEIRQFQYSILRGAA